MTFEATELDEVVVVGYGVQKRTHMTGSVAQVSSQELLKAPMQNVSNMLTGKLSGLTSIQRSGQPGSDGTELYVRGLRSFQGGNSPMVIVDGVPRAMSHLNPNDIETVSVLKDASAAIYGVQGSNGVILITTKSGKEGPARISYDGSVTATRNTAFPEYLSPSEYMYWNNKAREMDGLTPLWTADIQNKVMNNDDPESIWGQTDWFDQIFRTGMMQQHNISAAGGTERVKYYTSIGMMDQQGTIRKTDFSRYNIRTNLDIQVAKNLKFTTNLAGHRTERNWPGTDFGIQTEFGPIRQAITTIPIVKSEFQGLPVAWQAGSYYVNPVAALSESGYKQQTRFRLDSNYKLEYDFSDLTDILRGMRVSVFAAYNYEQTVDRNFDRYYELYFVNSNFDEGIAGASGYNKGNSFSKASSWGIDWVLRPQIEFSRTFSGKHSVGATLLMEKRRGYSDTMTGRRRGFFSDDPVDISLGTEYPTETDRVQIVSGSYSYSGIHSYVGRLNYAYGNKYLAEFAIRRDGSYKFAPENRWGNFPSASLGWVVSQEDFFKDAIRAIDFLKLRASYGQMVKDEADPDRPFMYNSTYKIAQNSYVLGNESMSQFYTDNPYVIRHLIWEAAQTYNIGVDLNMWKGLLGMELDLFYTYTSNILERVPNNFPLSLGGYFPNWENSGKMSNRGFEITLKHNNRINEDWSYHLRGTFAFARNTVLQRARSDNYPNYRPQVGTSLGARYGFKAIGLFQTQEEIDLYPGAPSGEANLGAIKYLDVNGDGMIHRDHDYVKIGYGGIPEINFNFNMDVSWKNFFVSTVWQGVSHCDYELSGVYESGVTSSTYFTAPFPGGFGNTPRYLVEGAWTPENTNAKYPRLTSRGNSNTANRSSWWVVNGTYLRLKNMNIGYDVPANVLQRTPFSRINIYLAGTNLLTFSHFKYVDPESPSVSNGHYPQQKTYSAGLNITF
jgi:TonB-linked SusC/RagA family outer membrane protein